MNTFSMNGIIWSIRLVEPDNPILIDRTSKRTVACTDPLTKRIYISKNLRRDMYMKVLMHELCHCTIISYGLQDYIYKVVKPEYWVEAEEFMCNLIADYGFEMEHIAKKISLFMH